MAMSYGDDLRPPAAIPGSSAAMPNWPGQRITLCAGCRARRSQPVQSQPMRPVQTAPIDVHPVRGETMRWVPGPQGVEVRPSGAPARYAPEQAPVSQPMSLAPPSIAAPERDDIPDDAVVPETGGAAHAARLQSAALPGSRGLGPRAARRRRSPATLNAAGDARLSAGVRARPLGHRRRAAGGAALVRHAGRDHQADRLLLVPRNGRRRRRRTSPSTPSAMRSTSPASRSPTAAPSRVKDRLARHAGGAGLPARRAAFRLRDVLDGAGAGLQHLSLRPHPRGPDAARRADGIPAGPTRSPATWPPPRRVRNLRRQARRPPIPDRSRRDRTGAGGREDSGRGARRRRRAGRDERHAAARVRTTARGRENALSREAQGWPSTAG